MGTQVVGQVGKWRNVYPGPSRKGAGPEPCVIRIALYLCHLRQAGTRLALSTSSVSAQPLAETPQTPLQHGGPCGVLTIPAS